LRIENCMQIANLRFSIFIFQFAILFWASRLRFALCPLLLPDSRSRDNPLVTAGMEYMNKIVRFAEPERRPHELLIPIVH
jgi:hypothetical protein